MGEFSTLNAIKSVMIGTPSFCVKGLNLREHLSRQLMNLEYNIQELKNKVEVVSVVPFDVEKDSEDEIATKSLDCIVHSLTPLITHLNLEKHLQIKNDLPKILKGKLKSNEKPLKDVTKAISTLHEIQLYGFEFVVDKIGKDAEVDIINISCNDNKINIVFGECKVNNKIQFFAFCGH